MFLPVISFFICTFIGRISTNFHVEFQYLYIYIYIYIYGAVKQLIASKIKA